ncbi:unnamed protein product, partial [Pylaiella littoralis]
MIRRHAPTLGKGRPPRSANPRSVAKLARSPLGEITQSQRNGGAQTKEGPRDFGAMLEQNFAGVHDIVISRVRETAFIREASEGGVERMAQSMRERGYIKHDSLPSVVIPRTSNIAANGVPEGALILNGNLRLKAAKLVFGEDFKMSFAVYYDFEKPCDRKAAACVLQSSAEELQPRTIYDNFYFWCDFLTDLPKPDYPHVKQAFER